MKRLIHLGSWLFISLAGGAAGHYFFDFSFLGVSAIVGAALIINGTVAELEDRQTNDDA